VGIRTIYTATVTTSLAGLGGIEPSGAVEFLDAGQAIGLCVSQPLLGGAATCAITYSSVGAHAITARYLGDANFAASSSRTELVGATSTPAGLPGEPTGALGAPTAVLRAITSTMQWTFNYTPSYTMVSALVVNGAPLGGTVLVACHGRGCPFASRAVAVSNSTHCGINVRRMCSAHGTVFITPGFQGRHLGIGTRITVAIMRPTWVGKYYAFTIEARRAPRVQIACLAPAANRPGGDC
jgi:hypothetical protein